MDPDTVIKDVVELLKQRVDLSPHQLLDAFFDRLSIPVTVFSSGLTPLEAATTYLVDVRKIDNAEVARLLSRPYSTVRNALANAAKKKIQLTEDAETPYRIPTTAFSKELTPAESVALYLAEHYGLATSTIAKLLGRDPRNVWNFLNSARKKEVRNE